MLVSHRRDQLIQFVKELLRHSFVLDALEESAEQTWSHVEELIDEHRKCESSRLKEAVPTVGSFFTPLPLARAWRRFDATYRISKRRFVSPSFNEIREILNLAQVLAFQRPSFDDDEPETKKNYSSLEFVTFDGDCTLYSDGKNFNDTDLASMIRRLLDAGVRVAVVTAAGYGYDATKYEKRLEHLLGSFGDLDDDTVSRFFVVGGESNYLFQAGNHTKVGLHPREEAWATCVHFDETAVRNLLDVAETSLRNSVDDLQLDARVLRKPRAVGLIPAVPRREILDEAVLRAQDALKKHRLNTVSYIPPYCAFNGGSDVWVDVGNKRVGVTGLQHLLNLKPENSLHIGDQFLNTGNDFAARAASCCLWITDPNETKAILADILAVVELPFRRPDPKDSDLPLPPSPRGKSLPRLFPPDD